MSTPADNLPSAPGKKGGLGGTVTIMGHKVPIVVLAGVGIAIAIFLVLRMRSQGSGVALGQATQQAPADAYSGANAAQAQLDQLATNTSELQTLISALNSQMAQGGQTTPAPAPPYAAPLPEWQFGVPALQQYAGADTNKWVWHLTPAGVAAFGSDPGAQPGNALNALVQPGVNLPVNSWQWSPVPKGMTADEYAALLNNPGSDPSQLATYSPPVQQTSTAAPTLSSPVPAGGL